MIAIVDAHWAEIFFQKINDRGHMIFTDIQGIHVKSIVWIGRKIKAGTGRPKRWSQFSRLFRHAVGSPSQLYRLLIVIHA
jgi:hypothetical protein